MKRSARVLFLEVIEKRAAKIFRKLLSGATECLEISARPRGEQDSIQRQSTTCRVGKSYKKVIERIYRLSRRKIFSIALIDPRRRPPLSEKFIQRRQLTGQAARRGERRDHHGHGR
jgi:hypothetical protein